MKTFGKSAALRCLALGFVGIAVSSTAGAQEETKGRRFMREVIGFTADDFQALDRGEVVTRLLDTSERGEIAAFGATAVHADPATFYERMRDIPNFRHVPGVLELGTFRDPPTVADLAPLAFPEEDVEALRECRPGKCDVKLGPAFIERLRREVDWSRPGARDEAIAIAKQAMVAALEAYQARGTAGLGLMVDKKEEKSRAEEFRTLLADSPYFLEYVPEFFAHLRDYPKPDRSGCRDAFYWTKDHFGPKQVVSMYHVAVYWDGNRLMWAQKTLYASHYFNAGLEVWSVAPSPSGRGFDLLMLYRTRLDPPTGMLAGILMGKVRQGIRTAVERNLESAKAKAERPATPQHTRDRAGIR
jgi:hypothetical protein